MINRQITQVHQFILEFYEFLKYTFDTDYYSSLIMYTHKNSKGKYWVVSQQALFFNAFLARHDDDNDAPIKDKN